MSISDWSSDVCSSDLSFQVRAGEVVGIAGVQGNGQTELIKSLLGLVKPDAGKVLLNGEDISRHGTRKSPEAGIGYVPEDRGHDGFVAEFSVRENLVLDLYRSSEFSHAGPLRHDARSEEHTSELQSLMRIS